MIQKMICMIKHGKLRKADNEKIREIIKMEHTNMKPKMDQKNNKSKSKTSFSVGQLLEVEIKKIGINGEGVGYNNRQVLFIPGALPTEIVQAKVTKVEKTLPMQS